MKSLQIFIVSWFGAIGLLAATLMVKAVFEKQDKFGVGMCFIFMLCLFCALTAFEKK